MDKKHELYMRRALDLAKLGGPAVRTNPLVGACIVYKDRIIGEGYHAGYGKEHAEVRAIKDVAEMDRQFLSDSVMYVNLEPCNHHGKTGPCSRAIEESGIRKVYIAMADVNPIAGGGAAYLRNKGIEVLSGLLEDEARVLNRAFLTGISEGRPYVTLKWAQTADGIMGMANSRLLISNSVTQMKVHDLRRRHNAIIVGSGTIKSDNPSLTTRDVPGAHPLRVVLSNSGDIPEDARVVNDDHPLVVFTKQNLSFTLRNENKVVHKQAATGVLFKFLSTLYEEYQIGSVLVEGGRRILDQFILGEVWDECWRITSSTIIGEGLPAPILRSRPSNTFFLGNDRIEVYHSHSGQHL